MICEMSVKNNRKLCKINSVTLKLHAKKCTNTLKNHIALALLILPSESQPIRFEE